MLVDTCTGLKLYHHGKRSWVIDFNRFSGKALVRRAMLSCDSSYYGTSTQHKDVMTPKMCLKKKSHPSKPKRFICLDGSNRTAFPGQAKASLAVNQ